MLQGLGETFFLSTVVTSLARAVLEQGRDDEAMELTKTAEASAADDDQVEIDSGADPGAARRERRGRGDGAAREIAFHTEAVRVRAMALSALARVLGRGGRSEESRSTLLEAIAI